MKLYLTLILTALLNCLLFPQSPHGDNFNLDCSICHTVDNWKVDITKIEFDHSTTNFNLTGQHKSVDCQSCHKSLVFSQAETNCNSCHIDIHEGTVGFECERCHETTSWIVKDISGVHQMSRFPLVGSHQIADCDDCHLSASTVNFKPIGIECYDCHAQDYNSAQNPNHIASGFSNDCQECHEVNATEWRLALFAHNFFPLIEGHSISNCFECHETTTYEGLSDDCFTCHSENYNAAVNPPHVELQFSTTCDQCHSLSPGWSPARFDQHDDFYALLGAHAEIRNECSSCHSTGYTDTPNQCFDCHSDDYNSTDDPSHAALNFSHDCEECHSLNAWEPATFDHDGQYFPIYSGEHRGEWDDCSDCHVQSNDYAVFECITCHEHNNQSETDSEHREVNGYIYLSTACYDCHPTGSEDGSFNHNTTNFPLEGSHINVDCSDCHVSNTTLPATECMSCHEDSYINATDPNHQQIGMAQECETCHTSAAWSPSSFTHQSTGFELLGGHAQVACNDCHNVPSSQITQNCFDCHNNDYSTAPEHTELNYPQDCELCHTEFNWTETSFDHAATEFPLTGGHINIDCSSCHIAGYVGTTQVCYDCHTDDFNQAPEHVSQNYPTDCQTCHSTANWEESTFDHAATEFPLTGGHINVDCSSCHVTGYAGTTQVCYDCHTDDFNLAPEHVSQNYPTDCETCHSTANWEESTFDHAATEFPLTGGHVNVDCSSCHITGYVGTTQVCYDCHTDDFNQAPEHVSQNYPTDCETCHSTANWEESTFDHAATEFPLTGGHLNVNCSDCHSTGYVNTSTVCNDCHSEDFNTTTNPSHPSLGLSTDCTICHTTNPNWTPAEFPNHNDYYALLGAHASLLNDCQSCHNGNYTTTANTCFGCHESDFNNVTDPNHQSAGFSTDCETCHTQSVWSPSTFDHDGQYFPIYSGEHNNEWDVCADCHNVQSDFTIFTCIDCHEHNQSEMDDEHDDVQDYVYESTACYDCHPDGKADDIIIPAAHERTVFKLFGGHVSLECNDCHTIKNNFINYKCTHCHEHSSGAMKNIHRSIAGFRFTDESCVECHPTGSADLLMKE